MFISVTAGNNTHRETITIDSSTTLMDALKQQGIDPNVGTVALNGSTLQRSELSKTFDDFGITDSCFLIASVKADNAAEVKVIGSAVVISSTMTPDQLATLKKYRPDSLVLTEGDGAAKKTLYAIGVAGDGDVNGSFNAKGAIFSRRTNAAGKATITIPIPAEVSNTKGWAVDTLGVALLHLNKLEEGLTGKLEEVATEKKAVEDAISAE